MPINRSVLILIALSALFALVILQLDPAAAQQPVGITLTPTESEQTATPTDSVETPTATEPATTATPTPIDGTATPTEDITIPPPLDTGTPTPTENVTNPPPSDTGTPTQDEPRNRSTQTPPVLPATGQSPLGGGFPVESIFAVLLLVLVGWFFLRTITRADSRQ